MPQKKTLTDAIVEQALETQGKRNHTIEEIVEIADGMLEEDRQQIESGTDVVVPAALPWKSGNGSGGKSTFTRYERKEAARERLRMKREIIALRGYGFTVQQVALVTGINEGALVKEYKSELERGALIQNAAVLKNLYSIATDPSHRNSAQAAIFWAKSRAGWTETSRHEVTGGLNMQVSQAPVLDSSKLSADQREKLREIMEAAIAQREVFEAEPLQEEKIAGEEEDYDDDDDDGDGEDQR